MASRISCATVALSLLLVPAFWEPAQPRMSRADEAAAAPSAQPVNPVADVDRELASVQGIQAWAHILALSDADDPVRRAPTLFVPSDNAMRVLPDGMIEELIHPNGDELRHAFLARSATEARIALKDTAGKRVLLQTLDGRPLVIDATGGDIQVGDTEAIEIRTLSDGRSLFILDHVITDGSVDPE